MPKTRPPPLYDWVPLVSLTLKFVYIESLANLQLYLNFSYLRSDSYELFCIVFYSGKLWFSLSTCFLFGDLQFDLWLNSWLNLRTVVDFSVYLAFGCFSVLIFKVAFYHFSFIQFVRWEWGLLCFIHAETETGSFHWLLII